MTALDTELREWSLSCTKQALTPVVLAKLGSHSSVARRHERHISAYTFTYEVDGLAVAGYLVAPRHRTGRLPVLIYNRGGTGDYGLVPVGQLFTRFADLALMGYLVVGSQYPGNALSEGHDERGGASDVNSVLRLHSLITRLSAADAGRIGMLGDSRGGMMTYLCMAQADWLKAALTIGGLVNVDRSLELRPELAEVYRHHFGNGARARKARSVICWTDRLDKRVPLCLLHGGADDKVDPLDALDLAAKLQTVGHPYALHIFDGCDHGLRNRHDERNRLIRS
jgi:dipeptidyl aminopeptidase/acylaminoacyl peptidase